MAFSHVLSGFLRAGGEGKHQYSNDSQSLTCITRANMSLTKPTIKMDQGCDYYRGPSLYHLIRSQRLNMDSF